MVKIPEGVTVHAAPVAAVEVDEIVILSPGKTLLGPVNIGLGFTLRFIVASLLQEFDVPITVNG